MADLVPSVLLYGQAIKMLEELEYLRKLEPSSNTEQLVEKLAALLTDFENTAGRPLVNYESVAETEPPDSEKMNRFWRSAEIDINLLKQQVDLIRASAIFTHNLIKTEIINAQRETATLKSKVKTLQLFTSSNDRDIVTFGDSFDSLDLVDVDFVDPSEQPYLSSVGQVTLAPVGELFDLSKSAGVRILHDDSNGFLGNNQEVIDPLETELDPRTRNSSILFKSEIEQFGNVKNLLDSEPNTWIEYEVYKVAENHRRSANDLGFQYSQTLESGEVILKDWANGPDRDVLKLGLEFTLPSIQQINTISLTPFGLEANSNNPVYVDRIRASANGTDWIPILPEGIWIGTDVNVSQSSNSDLVVPQKAYWNFSPISVKYIRIFFEQRTPVNTQVGHAYWLDKDNPNESARVEGPIPDHLRVPIHHSREIVGNLVQRRELMPAKRWVIAIRDVELQQALYRGYSILVSKPFRVNGTIEKVILDDAEVEIPKDFPSTRSWISFYVSHDNGESWHPISRIGDSSSSLPKEISFNDPVDKSFKQGSTLNIETESPVNSIRLKAEIARPSGFASSTPVLKSYRLKVKVAR